MEQQWWPSFRPRFLETALCCSHWRAIPCFGVLCGFNGFEPRVMTNSGLLSTEMMPALLTEPYFRDADQWNPLITSFCSSNLYFSQRFNSSLTCFKVFPLGHGAIKPPYSQSICIICFLVLGKGAAWLTPWLSPACWLCWCRSWAFGLLPGVQCV